jgi:hypothetical protein
MSKRLLILVVAAVLAPRALHAQIYEDVGIRAQGMGGAFVAVADDATATWWNPAGLAAGPFFDALVEYDRIRTTPQTNVRALAVAFPALGASYYRLPINQMQASAATTAPGASSREDGGFLGVYGLTFGQSLGAHLVMASTLKLERAGKTRTDLDLGALARYGALQLGASVKNVRRTEFDVAGGSFRFDRQARAGLAILGHSDGFINNITLSVDADITTTKTVLTDVRHVAGGFELWIFKRQVGLRAGGSTNTVGVQGTSASGGFSVSLVPSSSVKAFLDAEYTNGSDETRRSWGIALRATF